MTVTVLLTRPAAQSRRFADDIRARLDAVPVLVSPLMEIALDTAAAKRGLRTAGGLILTSENAAAACRGLVVPQGLPAFCVGDRTAHAATLLGCDVRIGPGDLPGLVRLIQADGWSPKSGPLVHLRGAHVAGDAAAALAEHGITAESVVVYDQIARPLSRAALDLLGAHAPVVMPVFSPRSARLLARYIAQAVAPLGIAAISPAVAHALPMRSVLNIRIADSPNASSMLDAVLELARERKFS